MDEESIKNLAESMGNYKSLHGRLITFDTIMEFKKIPIKDTFIIYKKVSKYLKNQGKQATKVYDNFIHSCRLQNIKFNEFVL